MEMIRLYSALNHTERFELKEIIDKEIDNNNKLPLSDFIKVYKQTISTRLMNALLNANDKILKIKVCEITNNDLCKINNMGRKSLIEFNNLRQFK